MQMTIDEYRAIMDKLDSLATRLDKLEGNKHDKHIKPKVPLNMNGKPIIELLNKDGKPIDFQHNIVTAKRKNNSVILEIPIEFGIDINIKSQSVTIAPCEIDWDDSRKIIIRFATSKEAGIFMQLISQFFIN